MFQLTQVHISTVLLAFCQMLSATPRLSRISNVRGSIPSACPRSTGPSFVDYTNGESLTSSPEGRHQPGGTGPDNYKIEDLGHPILRDKG